MVYKAYGCVVVDTETKTIKNVHIPVILDLVQDRVRSRMYSILLTLLIIISSAYWALAPAFRYSHLSLPPLSVAEVRVVLPRTYNVDSTGALSPYPMITIFASDGSILSDRMVTIQAVVLGMEGIDELAASIYQPLLKGTVTEKTNSVGIVLFTNVSFFGNSKAAYSLHFECEGVSSASVPVSISTNVSSLELEYIPFASRTLTPFIGSPIDYTFRVLVSDNENNPLPNKLIVANINPFPQLRTIFPRYGLLKNNAVLTNEYGYAEFDNIIISASNLNALSLTFSCEGVSLSPDFTELGIQFQSEVGKVIIDEFPPSSIVEAGAFSSVVKITNKAGSPLSGKQVIAMIYEEAGILAYPKIFTFSKVLRNTVSSPSSVDGLAIFSNLYFTTGGRAGNYSLVFFCDGISSDPFQISVETTVQTVQVLMDAITPKSLLVNSSNLNETIFFTTRILDVNNNPISNKIVEVIGLFGNQRNTTIVSSMTDNTGSVTRSFYDINYAPSETYSFLVRCDGITSRIVNFTIDFSTPSISTQPAFANIIVPPSGLYTIRDKNSVQPVIQLFNNVGTPLANVTVIVAIFGYIDIYTPFNLPKLASMYQFLPMKSATDANGILKFGENGNDPFIVTAGFTGSLPVIFTTDNGKELSDVFIITVVSQVDDLLLSLPVTANSYISISPNEPVSLLTTMTLQVDNAPIGLVYPAIQVLKGASYVPSDDYDLLALFNGNGTNSDPYVGFKIIFEPTWYRFTSNIPCVFTGSTGFCEFSISVNGFGGEYIVAVEVNGYLSNSITLIIGAEVSQLVPIPVNFTKIDAVIQQSISEPASVQVLDAMNNPVSGMYVSASVCEHPEMPIINPNEICSECAISQPSDENGIAVFNQIFFISGITDEYQICFQFAPETEEQIEPAVWPVYVDLYNPIETLTVLYADKVITPIRERFNPVITINASRAVDFKIDLVQTAGTSTLQIDSNEFNTCFTGDECKLSYNIFGPDGFYSLAFRVSGYTSVEEVVLILDSAPASIEIDMVAGSYDTISSIISAGLMENVVLGFYAFTATGVAISGANFTVTILSHQGLPATLETTTCSTMSLGSYSDTLCTYNFVFTAGASGLYSVVVGSGSISAFPFTVNLTNPITQVEVVNAGAISSNKVVVSEPMKFQPEIAIHTLNNDASILDGRIVQAILVDMKGTSLSYMTKPVIFGGMAKFVDLTILEAVPGTYKLQFIVAGVASAEISVELENPAFPDYENLNLHHAQTKIVLGALLVIPLYIGNSARQPTWQLIISIPAFGAIGYVAYLYLFKEIKKHETLLSMGYAYALLDIGLRTLLIIAFVGYLYVIGKFLLGLKQKRSHMFWDNKQKACRPYIKHELISYGMKRYFEKQKPVVEEIEQGPIPKLSLLERVKSYIPKIHCDCFKKKVKHTAFFYPQRLLLGFGISVVCAFMVACTCVLLIYLFVDKIDNFQEKLKSVVGVAHQLQDFVAAGNTTAFDFWSSEKLSLVADVIGISSQQLQLIVADVQDGSNMTLLLAESAMVLLASARRLFHTSAIIALVLSGLTVLVSWIFVFLKYKERIFYLRKGRIDMITRNGHKFAINGAVTYVGLQAIHTAIAFFVLWTILTSFIMLFQVHAFWKWVWSKYPLFLAFVLGLPFLSKTITKFIIAHWILVNGTIVHLRLWIIFDFMWIFVNLMSSIVLSVLRFGLSMFSSIIYTMRMDTPLLREEFDSMDYGFKAYVGMLLMDHSHNNPVLLQFTNLLISKMKQNRKERKEILLEHAKGKRQERINNSSSKKELVSLLLPSVIEEQPVSFSNTDELARNRIIMKWWLLITLHNNPELQALRKHNIPKQPQTQNHH